MPSSGSSAAALRAISSRVSARMPWYSRALPAGRLGRIGRFRTSICTALRTTRLTNTPGRSTSSGSSSPTSTISSTSAIVTAAALAKLTLKLRLPPRNCRFPMRSARYARMKAKSVVMACSRTWGRPSRYRSSFPSARAVPTPTGV